ncbi:MAG: fimbrillin family protein [Bacteroidales bacterium]|nr:fimbrillin family protein [Bacteroidales bacterium]MBQ9186186.1 fimbrillin family protein [Bacteroidales bacterium]
MMKERICHIVLLLAAVLLTVACGKDAPERKKGDQISFSKPSIQTKMLVNQAVSGTSYPFAENFTVYTGKSASEWAVDGIVPGDMDYLMNGIDCGYAGSGASWDPASGASGTAYYWSELGDKNKLTAQAYSPTGAEASEHYFSGGGLAHSWTNGFTLTNFQSPEIGSQFDLMFSPRSYNYESSTKGGHVDLTFSHALSQVLFMVALHGDFDTHTKVYIKGLTVKNLFWKGTYEQGLKTAREAVDATPYNTGFPKWTHSDTEKDFAVYSSVTGVQLEKSVDHVGTSGWFLPENVFLPLPQNLTHDRVDPAEDTEVTLGIDYAFAAEDGTIIDEHREFLLKDVTDNPVWEMGKKYVYRIYIQPNSVLVSVKIIGWDAVTTIDIPGS